MTRLLLGAVLLGNLRVSVQDPVTLPPPAKVRFDSVDYKNILRWTPHNNRTSLQYSVQWKIYGERQWVDVASCQEIQSLQCDLSEVTSEPREWYYGRVQASLPSSRSAWSVSPRFSPSWNTHISPPLLELTVTEQEIVVSLEPPKPAVQKMHSGLKYKIYLKRASGEEKAFEMDCCVDKLTIKRLDRKATYCLQAQVLAPLQAKLGARSPLKCVVTL
ncbi:interleukin-22 receptor subunit alpha-2 [Brachionichthys hirsutus]|uniref:interleukin-22 receptor subunit alpha-2 n=1 Tax=Brachionichthys hirsutus TaxID=412623 RepID=UPI0036046DB7